MKRLEAPSVPRDLEAGRAALAAEAESLGECLVVLYVDKSQESQEAEKMLQGREDVIVDIERGRPGPGERYPVALYKSWTYAGIKKIKILCEQLDFNARKKALRQAARV